MQDGVYDAFIEKLTAAVAEMKVGDGLTGDFQQGPMIDMAAVEKVEEHIADALSKGAGIAIGGSFFEPTIIFDVTPQMLVEKRSPSAPWRRSSDSRVMMRLSGWQ